MQVICVQKFKIRTSPVPEIGDVCTITITKNWNGKTWYGFSEFPEDNYYISTAFATLPPEEPAVVNEQEFEAIIYQR